ncbi:aspartate/glutamate racemase family protein [Propionicicella superfundia]|uniref:aspartate/glutamate racemase family protein n=1 Tax=Propionicicella superfundia TaxID=348582 RepID=UPI000408C11D|nr:amino acid racemase [Propionicicella superfundia]
MIEQAIGVLGGVGPLATVYFMDRIVALTDAATDQEHVNLVVLQHATIPDRTAFIVGRSEADPLPVMLADARALEAVGVIAIAMPCNTAHRFHTELAASVRVPFLSIIDETIARARRRVPGLRRLGVLATDGTLFARTYHLACEAAGLECVVPAPETQAEVMDVIYNGVKAGVPVDRERFDALAGHLRDRGAEAVVLGCTELSILGHDLGLAPDVVDSLDALALRTIEVSGKSVKHDV